MMRIALSVEYADGSGAEVTASAPDLVAFERNFDTSMTVFGSNPRIEYVLWIAWHTLKRNGKTSDEFEKWMESVDSVEFGDSGE